MTLTTGVPGFNSMGGIDDIFVSQGAVRIDGDGLMPAMLIMWPFGPEPWRVMGPIRRRMRTLNWERMTLIMPLGP